MQDENKKLRRELAEGYGRAAGTRPEYAASYEKELSGVYDSMKNRPEFSYDANSDGLYRQYRDGYTPVRGTDYWTAEDKTAMVNAVLDALPDGDEVSY